MDEVIAIDSDNDVVFLGVRRKDYVANTWVYLNAGTCSWVLKKNTPDGEVVIANGTLTHQTGSNGDYKGVIESDQASSVNLVEGRIYIVDLVFADGSYDASRRRKKKARRIQ